MHSSTADFSDDAVVPYVVSIAWPDHKRPYVDVVHKVTTKAEMVKEIVNDYAEFLEENKCHLSDDYSYDDEDIEKEQIRSAEDIARIRNSFFEYAGMQNELYDVKAFVNGKWIDAMPTLSQVLQRLSEIYKHRAPNNEDS